jgi:hypothetical protein
MKQSRTVGISRLNFLKQSGGFLTAAALGSHCSSYSQSRFHTGQADPIQSARSSGLHTPIYQALAVGISAPNPHNVQPWKFRILSDSEALLYVDEKRLLPETDPTMRQVHMGQGALLELVAVGAGELGLKANIKLFPEGYSVTSDTGTKPVALIQLRAGAQPDPLYAFVSQRRTVRTNYSGPMITGAEYAQLRSLVKPHISELRVTPEQDLEKHIEFHFRGMQAELGYFPTADESRKWFRIGNDEIYGKRDGINLPSNGVTGFQKWFIETFIISHDPEDYYDPSGQKVFMDRYRESLFSAKGQILFITRTNTVKDWVLCGRDYARMQLAAHSLGLVMRPNSQLMQEFDAMKRIKDEYDRFVGVKSPSKTQINALLGRASSDFESPRRPLRDMIRS